MAFDGEKLLKAFRDPTVVLTPAQVEAAIELEKLLQPNERKGRKHTYPTGSTPIPTGEESHLANRPKRLRGGQ